MISSARDLLYPAWMKSATLAAFGLPLLLAACASAPKGPPPSVTQARAASHDFLAGLSASNRQAVLACQAQLRRSMGKQVYVVGAPALQGGGNAAAAGAGGLTVIYDRVDNGAITSAAHQCAPPAGAGG
jgi:hypothetical protein